MVRLIILALGVLLGTGLLRTHLVAQQTEESSSITHFFEQRTYTTHPGRLDALVRRFRDHTTRLFEKHGMINIGYWIPSDPPLSENTLIYILAYPSREARDASWAAFRADPDWVAAAAASQVDGEIVMGVESVFMDPTDFSAIR
jgi:hypothetical protein